MSELGAAPRFPIFTHKPLDRPGSPCYNQYKAARPINTTDLNFVNSFKSMSLTTKFKKDIQVLKQAANGEFYLDVKNPKLFKKVKRYYEQVGVVFSGDP